MNLSESLHSPLAVLCPHLTPETSGRFKVEAGMIHDQLVFVGSCRPVTSELLHGSNQQRLGFAAGAFVSVRN